MFQRRSNCDAAVASLVPHCLCLCACVCVSEACMIHLAAPRSRTHHSPTRARAHEQTRTHARTHAQTLAHSAVVVKVRYVRDEQRQLKKMTDEEALEGRIVFDTSKLHHY